jgi:hypothetical protein
MNEVPNIISTKDLAYIEDMIKWNLIMSKKVGMYKEAITDEDLKTLFDDIAKMHSNHYKDLMGILE